MILQVCLIGDGRFQEPQNLHSAGKEAVPYVSFKLLDEDFAISTALVIKTDQHEFAIVVDMVHAVEPILDEDLFPNPMPSISDDTSPLVVAMARRQNSEKIIQVLDPQLFCGEAVLA